MSKTFGLDDCKHVDEQDGSCIINKGCGAGGSYCRPIWNGGRCYSLEKPDMPEEFLNRIYAHNETLVMRDINGRCWQLKPGDYLGELPLEDLIFVKKATLSN